MRLVRGNPLATMLPLTVVQIPLGIIGAAVYFYLYHDAYPEADFESFNRFEDSPSGLILALVLMTAVYLLFSLVGAAATIVAVRTILEKKPARLTESLDPAFTRMGGLLLLGSLFYLMFLASAAGIVVVLYLIVRWGLAVHVHVLEGTSVTGSLGTSWRMLRGRMWRFIGVVLTAVPLGVALFFGASIIVAVALSPFSVDPGRTTNLVAQSLGILVLGMVAVPTGAYLAAATTIFYVSAKEESRV
ncbi:MAG: hypothetical protein AB7N24_07705 [Dehalococcoidia bacterium]